MSDALEQARQRRAGLREAMGRVERALATAATGRVEAWSAELRGELDGLSDALDQHVAITESDDGLLAEIVEIAPRLAHKADQARRDHDSLRAKVAAAVAAVPGTPSEPPAERSEVDVARDRVVELLQALVRHRHVGADLVYEAFNVDIEAAD